jgi:hypothetical protein
MTNILTVIMVKLPQQFGWQPNLVDWGFGHSSTVYLE